MDTTLFRTKAVPPPPRPRIARRPGLLARLDTLFEDGRRALLAAAQAGAGKTTLLADWAASRSGPAGPAFVWLTLDEGDNDEVLFFRYLMESLESACPGIAETAVESLRFEVLGRKVPPRGILLPQLCADLEAARIPVVLVLDDLHAITNPAVLEAIRDLAAQLPGRHRMAVAARAAPSIGLARLRARDELVELRTEDFRFGYGEAEDFLRVSTGLELPPETVKAIVDRTEGWAAGMRLSAASIGGAARRGESGRIPALVDAFARSDRYALEYLSEEVFAALPDDTRTFLLAASVLERLSAPLCEAVTLRKDSGAMLDALAAEGAFFQGMPGEPGWYRFDRLFADLLRRELAKLAREEGAPGRLGVADPTELHGRAAGWFESQGRVPEAVRHLVAAGDLERAADLVSAAAFEYAIPTRTHELLAMLSSLPTSLDRARPRLALARALGGLYLGRIVDVEAALRESTAGEPRDEELAAAASVVRFLGESRTAHSAALVALGEEAVRRLPPEAEFLRANCLMNLGVIHKHLGDPKAAMAALRPALEAGERLGSAPVIMSALVQESDVLFQQGELGSSLRACGEIFRRTPQAAHRLALFGMVHVRMGAIMYERGELESAIGELETARERALLWGSSDLLAYGEALLALAAWASGDQETARTRRSAAESALEDNFYYPALRPATEKVWARLAAAMDDGRAAERWLAAHPLPCGEELPAIERLAFLWASLSAGRYGPMVGIARAGDGLAEANGRVGDRVEFLALEAAALDGLGRGDEAGAKMDEALALGAPRGYLRVFLDAWRPTSGLLRRGRESALAEASALLDGGTAPGNGPGEKPRPPAPAETCDANRILSRRELEVLALADEGIGNEAIAERLFISVATVKTHVNNIFRKLDAETRIQALRRARELGLLP